MRQTTIFDSHLPTTVVPRVAHPTVRIPALAVTATGRIVVACDLRPSFHDLPGEISIIYRISDDQGASWSDIRLLIATRDGWGYGDPSLIATADGRLFCLYVASRALSFWDDFGHKTGSWQLRLAVSEDDGETWTHRDLTSDLIDEAMGSAFFSSGNGIQLSSGRLVNPIVWHGPGERVPRVSMALSDDGEHWFRGNPIPGQADETKVAELSDGTLVASIRSYLERLVSSSADQGLSWSSPRPMCPDPGCNAGLSLWEDTYALTLPQPHLGDPALAQRMGDPSGGRSTDLQDWSARRHLCLMTGPSPEDLRLNQVITPGNAAYSVTTLLPEGRLAIAWEHGTYEEIRFATVPISPVRSLTSPL